MAGRLLPLHEPIVFTLDGERVVAERGEPVAASLIGAGHWTLARSPKFHRPRGPACMRGACDGCLARVDGVPNVMTCLVPAEAGLDVRSQNTLGSREMDFLRMTDWFFPDGMNHHELFAGVPGVQSAMQVFARRVAGLGHLPDATVPPKTARRRSVDVLVVGAGPAGMAVAMAAAKGGHAVEVVDDGLLPGGGARGLMREDEPGLATLRDDFARTVASAQLRLRSRTVAGAVFGRDVLVVGTEVEVLEPRCLVIAAGAHDGVVPFENNDFPGVLSARAACLLGAAGISLGQKVVMHVPDATDATADEREQGSTFASAFERRVAGREKMRVTRVRDVVRVKGSSHLRSVVVRENGNERSIPADVLLVDAPRAPAYELCEQAGATLEHRSCGFVPVTERGRIADGVWAIGEVTGAPLLATAFLRAAEEIAAQL